MTAETVRGGRGAPPAAAVAGVTKTYAETRALQDVSMSVRAGEAHALVGRNGAGKSTLVQVLTGLVAPDAGTVRFDGEPAPAPRDRGAWRARVGCVYQHTTIVPSLTVAENLFLNRSVEGEGRRIDWRRRFALAAEALAEWGLDIDPRAEASSLATDERQLLEIGRALSQGSRFLILDEPTARLEAREITRLFERLRRLQADGVTFLYISHHLQEIYDLCQTVTVLRDGRHVLTEPVADLSRDALIDAMVGDVPRARRTATAAPPPRVAEARAVLRVEALAVADELHGVDLTVAPGESVGIAGLAGSGKHALGEVLAGLRRPDGGAVLVADRPVPAGDVGEAIRAGVGYVPPDRHAEGFVPLLSIDENVTMTIPSRLGRWGLISTGRRQAVAGALAEDVQIVASSGAQPVGELSGGNQQKAVLARALASAPRVLVLCHPTAGVDIASKAVLFDAVDRARANGTAVLVISDELEELEGCDRTVVLFDGRVRAAFRRGWTETELVQAIEGVEQDEQ